MRLILFAAAAAAVSLPIAASAQDTDGWHLIANDEGFLAAVETRSIAADGTGRGFAMQISKQGDPHIAQFDVRADCAGRTVQVLRSYQLVDGKKTQLPAPASPAESVDDDPSAKAMLDYVCQAPLAGN